MNTTSQASYGKESLHKEKLRTLRPTFVNAHVDIMPTALTSWWPAEK